jgi:hypothetical protein
VTDAKNYNILHSDLVETISQPDQLKLLLKQVVLRAIINYLLDINRLMERGPFNH